MGIFGDFIGRIHKSNDITSVYTRNILPDNSSYLDTKDAPPFSTLIHEPFGGVGKPDSSSKDFQKLYSISAPIYRAVSVIANNIAMLPVRIMDGETDVTDKPEFQLFKTYNDQQTHFDFWEQTIGYLELTGEAFWLLDRDAAGKVISAFPVRPDLIEVVPSNQFVVDHYLFNKSGKAIRIESEDMFFLKYFNPTNHIRGLSPIAAAESDIVLELNAVTSSKSLFERGAQPSGIITTDMDMSQGDWERTRGYISKEHVGSASKGKIMFLTHGLKWQQMQLNHRDMQYMEQRQWTKDTVSEVYGIPPVFLMQFKEASVIANADVQYRLLWDTLKPKIKRIEQIVSEMFMPSITDAGPRIEFDLGNISALQPDIEKMADRYRVGFNMGAVSPNDFREDILGMDRLEDEMMDGHFVGSTMMPIGDIGSNFGEPEKSINGKLNKIDEAIQNIEKKSEIEKLSQDLNLTSQQNKESEVEIEKQRIQRALLRIQRRVGARFEKATVTLFKKQQADIIGKFGLKSYYKVSGMNVGDVFNFAAWVKEFEELGEAYIMEAVALAAEEFARSINGEFILSDPRVGAYVGTRTTEYATIVNQTTKDRIDKLLRQGAAENLTMAELGSSIESYFKSQTAFRAARIARTEVVSGTNYGRFHAMRQSGRVDNHMWMSQRDGLVRDAHSGIDGDVVKVGDAFNVPASYLGDATYPSDINERCFTLPTKVEKTAGDKRVDALLGDDGLSKDDVGSGLARKVSRSKLTGNSTKTRDMIGREWEKVLGSAELGYKGSASFNASRKAFYELLDKRDMMRMHIYVTEMWQAGSNTASGAMLKYMESVRSGVSTIFHSKYLDEIRALMLEFGTQARAVIKANGFKSTRLGDYLTLMRQWNGHLLKRFGFLNADDTITLYRGVSGSYFRDAGFKVPTMGHNGHMAMNSLESWTSAIDSAKGFMGSDGVIIKATFHVDDILFSPFSWDDISYARETEFVVGGLKSVSYKVVHIK